MSFILTYYNVPTDMLRRCLGSIFALSLSEEEREIILIDDGSDVSPISEISDYIDRIVYLRQKNGGLSVARNVGLDVAKGQYIQFVDTDDYLLRGPYSHCLDIVRYHNPDMVMFNATDKDDAEVPLTLPEPVDGATYMKHNNLRATAWGYIFRRKSLVDLRFTPGLVHEDEEFTPQLVLRCEKIYVTESEAYHYTTRDESITTKHGRKWKLKRLNDTEHILFHLQRVGESLPMEESKAMMRRVNQLTMDYIYNIIMLTRSLQNLEERIARLEKKGLFPLPSNNYTKKYKVFSAISRTKAGRKILLYTLPMMKKEK